MSQFSLPLDDDSSDTVSESSSDNEEIDPFELAGGVKTVFASLPIFRFCGNELIDKITDQAQRIRLGEGKVLDLQDGGPMYVVDSGAVVVTLGAGPPIVLGPGSVFNMVGMLRLAHEAEPFRPKNRSRTGRKATKNYAYEIFGPHFQQGRSPPLLWTDRRRKGDAKSEPGQTTSNDVLCFYNLCPSASAPGAAALPDDSDSGWLPLEIVGAPVEVVPTLGGDINFFRKGGASLVAVPLVLLEQVGCAFGQQTAEAVKLRSSLGTFKMNCARLADLWRTIMSRCSHVFPAVPPEVIWTLAEMSERREIEAGDVFVMEGTSGEQGESLILIDEGEALVEKLIGGHGKPRTAYIGRLGPGAIIGDLCLIGAGIPRAASVRAKSSMAVIEMPVKGLLALIRQFPGTMQGLAAHAKEVGSFIQLRLPPRLEVISAQEVFMPCKHEFCIEVSSHSEWTVFVGGQPIIAPGAKEEGTMYILEYGSCALEFEGQGEVEKLPPGACFGDGRRMGIVVPANATIRALTPLVIALAIRDGVMLEARTRHYAKERPPFERRPRTPTVYGLRNFDYIIANVDMFCQCERPFIKDLCKVVQTRGYMPGQTLFVEGAKDLEQQMFVIRGGLTYSELGGQRLEVPSKNTFGDLAMLGALHRRGVTVRAQTFCFTIEIPRTSFQEAIVSHPEQRQQFEAYAVQAMQQQPDTSAPQWPFLGCAPFRFIYLLNLYAGQKLFKANDPQLSTAHVKACALLVLQGKVAVVNEEGEEVELMTAGHCFNEQIFLGIAASATEHVVARTSCEVQIIPKEMWDNIMEEFPAKVDMINSSLMTYIAEKAAHKYGVKLSSPSVLRKAPLLRDVSLEFAEEMCKHLESLMIVPGMTICTEGKEGDRMLFLLRGKAYAESSSFGHVHYGVGYIFGEALLLNLRPSYPKTVWASNLCILQALHKKVFLEQVNRYSKEKEVFTPLLEEVQDHGVCQITKQVKNTVAFNQATIMFVSSICEHAEDKFFGGGEVIIAHGKPCVYGDSDLYVILKGHVRVEDELGVLLYYLQEGSVFGEAGALGMERFRSINVRACTEGLVHCARLIGEALEAALRIFPEEREFLDEVHYRRTEARAEFTKRRKLWLEQTVLPALAQSPLFLGCPPQFLQDLAAPLLEAWRAVLASASAPPALRAQLEAALTARGGPVDGRLELVELQGRGRGYRAARAIARGDTLLTDCALCSHVLPPPKVPAAPSKDVVVDIDEDDEQERSKQAPKKEDTVVDPIHNMATGQQPLVRILETHTWECTREPGHVAYFPLAGNFNHSCCPNAFADTSRSECTVRALTDICEGEEVCISYVPVSDNFKKRRQKLRQYGFLCTCKRCEEEAKDDPFVKVPCKCGEYCFTFGTFSEGVLMDQKCPRCSARFEREHSRNNLLIVSEANRKQSEAMTDHSEQYEAVWAQMKTLTGLERYVAKGATHGVPPLHLEAIQVLENLAGLHLHLALRLKGGQKASAFQSFHRYKKQCLERLEEKHGTLTNHRDACYLRALQLLSTTEGCSEEERQGYQQRLEEFCQSSYGQPGLPQTLATR